MKLLSALIPEPWLSLGIVAALLAALFYGDLTGSAREAQRAELARQKDRVAELTRTVAAIERQRAASVEIQTKMALRLSDFRAQSLQREKDTDDLVEQIRAESAERERHTAEVASQAGAFPPLPDGCILNDSRRMRLRAIPVGPARADPGAR